MKTPKAILAISLAFLLALGACNKDNINEPKPHYKANDLPELHWPPEISGWTYEKLQDVQSLPASGLPFYNESDYRKSSPEGLHFFNETQAYKRTDLLKTDDGGFTWKHIPFVSNANIKHTYFWSLDRGVVAYVPIDKDTLIFAHTEDGGANWISHTTNLGDWATPSAPAPDTRIFDLWFSNAQFGILLKHESTSLSLWATQDSGNTWTRNYGHIPNFHFIQALDQQTVILAERNQLILSQDAGQNWEVIADLPENQTASYGPSSFEAMSRDSLFFQVGGLHHSSFDGGQTWTESGDMGLMLRWKSGESFSYAPTGRVEIYSASNQPYHDVAYVYLALNHKPNANDPWIAGSNEVANQGISRFYHAGPDIIVGEAATKDGRVLFRYLRN